VAGRLFAHTGGGPERPRPRPSPGRRGGRREGRLGVAGIRSGAGLGRDTERLFDRAPLHRVAAADADSHTRYRATGYEYVSISGWNSLASRSTPSISAGLGWFKRVVDHVDGGVDGPVAFLDGRGIDPIAVAADVDDDVVGGGPLDGGEVDLAGALAGVDEGGIGRRRRARRRGPSCRRPSAGRTTPHSRRSGAGDPRPRRRSGRVAPEPRQRDGRRPQIAPRPHRGRQRSRLPRRASRARGAERRTRARGSRRRRSLWSPSLVRTASGSRSATRSRSGFSHPPRAAGESIPCVAPASSEIAVVRDADQDLGGAESGYGRCRTRCQRDDDAWIAHGERIGRCRPKRFGRQAISPKTRDRSCPFVGIPATRSGRFKFGSALYWTRSLSGRVQLPRGV